MTDTAAAAHALAVRMAGLAQSGLTFAENPFDIERYGQMRALAAELMALLGETPVEPLRVLLEAETGYATPKVDVRGAVFDDAERVLLMRERSDGRWPLPGGWLDTGTAPADGVVKEMREESGLVVEATKLVGAWDRTTRGHLPHFPIGIVKLFFLCRQVGEPGPPDALETLEIGWFALDALPELSLGRVNPFELERCLAHHRDPSLPAEFD